MITGMAHVDRCLADEEELVHVARRHRAVPADECVAPALTTQRSVTREGIGSEQGRPEPLTRVNGVSYGVSLWERLMRYGTLSVQPASVKESMTLQRVPRPQRFRTVTHRRVRSAQSPGCRSAPSA